MQPRFHPLTRFRLVYRLRRGAWFGRRAFAPLAFTLLLAVGAAALLWAAPVHAQAQPAPVHDFDQWCQWRRGAQPWGSLTQSDEQVHQGTYAGALAYDFPEGEAANFVVFQCAKPLRGTPEYLSVWVYGDGAGHLLNAWVQDATGLRWQFAFGPVDFTGWQRMTAHMAPGQPWPNGPLDGSAADTVMYPIRFDGFALDNPTEDAAEGVIYLDDLRASSMAGGESAAPAPGRQAAEPTPAPTPTPAPESEGAGTGSGAEDAQEPEVDFWVDPAAIEAGECAALRWTVRQVREYFVDGEGKAGDTGRQEVCPEATTTYTLRVETLAGEQAEYTVEVEVTGEPPDQITVDDAEVLSEPLNLKGVNDNPGIRALAVAPCTEVRQRKCADMGEYQANPSFGKSTKACLVWVEEGAPFGAIDIAVRRQAPNPQTELWTASRDALGNFACIGVPIQIGRQGSYAAVLTAEGVNKTVQWRVK